MATAKPKVQLLVIKKGFLLLFFSFLQKEVRLPCRWALLPFVSLKFHGWVVKQTACCHICRATTLLCVLHRNDSKHQVLVPQGAHSEWMAFSLRLIVSAAIINNHTGGICHRRGVYYNSPWSNKATEPLRHAVLWVWCETAALYIYM